MSEGADPIKRAVAVDEAASTLDSFRDMIVSTTFAGGAGVETSADGFDLKRRRISKVDGEINSIVESTMRVIGGQGA